MVKIQSITNLSQPLHFSWNILSTRFNSGTLTFVGIHCKIATGRQKNVKTTKFHGIKVKRISKSIKSLRYWNLLLTPSGYSFTKVLLFGQLVIKQSSNQRYGIIGSPSSWDSNWKMNPSKLHRYHCPIESHSPPSTGKVAGSHFMQLLDAILEKHLRL